MTNWSPTSSEFNNKGETSIVTAFILAGIVVLPFFYIFRFPLSSQYFNFLYYTLIYEGYLASPNNFAIIF